MRWITQIASRALREDHNYTQQQIADMLHVGQRTYADYELRRIRMPLESMIELAEFYRVDLNCVAGISGELRPYPNK